MVQPAIGTESIEAIPLIRKLFKPKVEEKAVQE